ncbi:urea transporter [Amphritea pacifica]|uniref:urea transporter n=1 Tax=Amphritea pacifica TaxID=2811233 RepID=UPI001962424B|nr:urea transporter [Amphritea pacifica]MBN1008095.1 urea transporter [Amphritea pacifica]
MVSSDVLSWPGLLWRTPFLHGVLTSFSQILLQHNRWTGLLFILAVAIQAPIMAVAAVLGCVVEQLCTLMLLSQSNRQHNPLGQGLYGFNGALVGLAVSCLWPLSGPLVLMLTVAVTLLATIIGRGLQRLDCATYTSPFILSVWLLWLLFTPQPMAQSGLSDIVDPGAPGIVTGLLSGVVSAVGQVLFLNSSVSGALLLAGLFIASRAATLVVVCAVILSLVISLLLDFPMAQTQSGVYSYNAVLVILALHQRSYLRPLTFVCGVLLAVLLSRLLQLFDVMPLTAPFVLSVWTLSCLFPKPDRTRVFEKVS